MMCVNIELNFDPLAWPKKDLSQINPQLADLKNCIERICETISSKVIAEGDYEIHVGIIEHKKINLGCYRVYQNISPKLKHDPALKCALKHFIDNDETHFDPFIEFTGGL